MRTLAAGRTEFLGYSFVVLAGLFFAIGFSFASATGGTFSVWQLVFVRGMVFALALLPWAARHPQIAKGTNRRLLLLRGLLGTAMVVCGLSAVIALPLSIATLLAKTTPLWELFMVWALFALRPLIGEVLLVPVAILGLVLILHPEGHLGILALSYAGLLLGLASGMFNSLEYITLNRVRRSDPSPTINLWYAATAIVSTLPFAISQPWPDDPMIWLILVAFCLCSLAGQMLLAEGMHSVSPTIASVGTLLVPIFATLIAWVVFHQSLSGLEVGGMVIVLAAAALVIRMESRRRAALGAAVFRWQRTA